MTVARPRLHHWVLVSLIAALFAVMPATSSGAGPQTCDGLPATIVAEPGVITRGTSGPDVIVGTNGDDIIIGGAGDDVICAGAGDDVVRGNGGNDRIFLGRGDDQAFGGRGRDRLVGNAGFDIVDGGPGIDTCHGNETVRRCEAGGQRGPSNLVARLEARLVDQVNGLRASVGRAPLTPMPELADVARAWSHTLPDEFAHNPNVGNEIPSGWSTWGENIGYRMDPSRTTEQNLDAIQAALTASPGHYANMTADFFDNVGIGVVVIGDAVYVTQVFATY